MLWTGLVFSDNKALFIASSAELWGDGRSTDLHLRYSGPTYEGFVFHDTKQEQEQREWLAIPASLRLSNEES